MPSILGSNASQIEGGRGQLALSQPCCGFSRSRRVRGLSWAMASSAEKAAAPTEGTMLMPTKRRQLPKQMVAVEFFRWVGAVHIMYFHFGGGLNGASMQNVAFFKTYNCTGFESYHAGRGHSHGGATPNISASANSASLCEREIPIPGATDADQYASLADYMEERPEQFKATAFFCLAGLLGQDCGDYSFAAWGESWVHFFFLLSGFGTAYSRIHKLAVAPADADHSGCDCCDTSMWSKLMPTPSAIMRRYVAIWPLYFVATILCVIVECGVLGVTFEFNPFLCETLAVQAYAPTSYLCSAGKPESQIVNGYNVPAWFISALIACWILENVMFKLATMGTKSLVAMLTSVAALYTWTFFWPLCHFPFFYTSVSGGEIVQPISSVNFWPDAIELKGLQYLQIYMSGMLLAWWVHRRADSGEPPIPYAGCIGLLAVVALCSALPVTNVVVLSAWWNSGLTSPFLIPHALLLIAFAEQDDPMVLFLEEFPRAAKYARDMSLGVYLLHWPFWKLSSMPELMPYTVLNGYSEQIGICFAMAIIVHIVAAVLIYVILTPSVAWLTMKLRPGKAEAAPMHTHFVRR